jgi:hypothetical protein
MREHLPTGYVSAIRHASILLLEPAEKILPKHKRSVADVIGFHGRQ